LSVGCNKLFAKDTPAPKEETEESEGPKAKAKATQAKAEHGDENEAAGSGRFAVPFAWEASPEEPLAKARNFMAEVLKANETFVGQGSGHFKPFLDAESPRATVLTCADSRVQSAAWDDNPENDAYTVRNLGNQLSTSLGSVQYGVDSLNTPVLLIIGHTGCDAVKAALGKDKGKGAIADEIAHIELPGLKRSKDFDTTWNNAVLSNVNAQVGQAVSQFSNHVQSGDLTVVGAVYDFRNDLENGSGRLSIVNVNGNVEKARIEAFEEAVQEVNKKKAAAQASLSRRTLPGPIQPLDRSQLPNPGARASVNALNMLASGSFPALRPGMPVPGTVDLKAAPSYRPNVPRAAASEDDHGGDHGEKKAPAARHGAPTGSHGAGSARRADAHDSAGDEHDEDTAHAAPARAPRAEAARAAAHATPTDPRFQPPPSRPAAAATGHASEPASGHAAAATPGAPAASEQTPAAAGQYRPAPYNPMAPPPAQRAATSPPRPGAATQGAAPVQAAASPGRAPTSAPSPARAPAPAPAPPATLYPTLGAPPARAPVAGQPSAPAQRAATPAPAPAAPVQRGAAPVRGAAAQPPRGAAPGQGAAPAKPPAAGQPRTPAPAPTNPAARAGAAPSTRPGAAPAAPARPTTPAAPPAKTAAPAPARPPAPPAKPAPPKLPLPGPVTSGPAWPEDEGPPNQRRAPAAKPGAAPAAPANPAPPADPGKTPAKPPARKVPPRKGT
jgi:carbonic anhydrase